MSRVVAGTRVAGWESGWRPPRGRRRWRPPARPLRGSLRLALEEVPDHREVRLRFVLEDGEVARLAEDDELAAGDALCERPAAALWRQLVVPPAQHECGNRDLVQ